MRQRILHAALLIGIVPAFTLPAQNPVRTPSRAGDPLTAAEGWIATAAYQNDAGIVAVGAGRFSAHWGSPQALLIDRDGRGIVLQSDGGRFAAHVVVEDGAMLSGWAFGDLDPRQDGGELYLGGRNGKLYQVRAVGPENWESRLVLTAGGETLGRFALGDFVKSRPGVELILFASSGPILVVTPDCADGGFRAQEVGRFASRVRCCVVIPGDDGGADRAAVVAQDGEVSVVSFADGTSARRLVSRETATPGRIARKPRNPAGTTDLREVLYVGRVDGLVLRYGEQDDGSWVREPVYVCAEGIGGIAAGRFSSEARSESVAIFTSGGKVQILSRSATAPWTAETIFHDDQGGGHWLVAEDLDERNGTDELVGGGMGRRLMVLSRPPGYALSGIALDPDLGAGFQPQPSR